jgi:drug/metabolite transporter (DMT)-like permease
MLGAPMLLLALATLFSASFAIAIRFSQKRGANMTAVAAVNYLFAAAFHAAASAAAGFRVPHASTALIGVVGGGAYAAAFFLLQAFMMRRGVSVTGAVTRLSVLVPVAVSLAAWGERASPLQAAGIGLAVLSLPLLSLGPAPAARADPPGLRSLGSGRAAALLVGLFVVNGLCLLAPRAFRQTEVQGEDALFLLILFASAALCACAVWAAQEARVRRAAPTVPAAARPALLASALLGIVVGLCNALASRFVVASLVRLTGIIVYPFYSAVGLLLTVAFSALVWKERIRVLEAVGMGLALASIVLVNLA